MEFALGATLGALFTILALFVVAISSVNRNK